MSTNQSRRYIVGPKRDMHGTTYVEVVSRWFITVWGRPPQEVGSTMKLYTRAALRKWGTRHKVDVSATVEAWDKMDGVNL